jgi:copper chaperone CopZ
MKRLIPVALAVLVIAPLSALAAQKTVVKQSLVQVPGVKTVDIKQANQMAPFMATVTFDDTVADVPALIAATTKAGYPSSVIP